MQFSAYTQVCIPYSWYISQEKMFMHHLKRDIYGKPFRSLCEP